MMLMTDDDPIDTTFSGSRAHDAASDAGALRRAMALGHLDIEPFDDARSESGTYELGFTAHGSALERPALEPGATATVESLEFLKLSPSIMARLWVAAWAPGEGLRISAERLLPPRFRGRVCAYVTNIGGAPITLEPRARLIAVEVHFLSDAGSGWDTPPCRPAAEPSARVLESASRGRAAERGAGAMVRIDDLRPLPFALRHAIFIAVGEREGAFRARFAEADIEAAGDCPDQAIASLKRQIVATHGDLAGVDPDALDRRRLRQRRVLGDLLRREESGET